jgi:hypothetical protein
MEPFNLLPNVGKTQVLIYVTPGRLPPLDDPVVQQDFKIGNAYLERVINFKYLGIHVDFLINSSPHEDICFRKANAAAIEVGRICMQLEIRDYGRLQTYLLSFVVSQLHGTQLVLF